MTITQASGDRHTRAVKAAEAGISTALRDAAKEILSELENGALTVEALGAASQALVERTADGNLCSALSEISAFCTRSGASLRQLAGEIATHATVA
jgi:hypothetical protein